MTTSSITMYAGIKGDLGGLFNGMCEQTFILCSYRAKATFLQRGALVLMFETK